jgi:Rap1a immunity proteins
MGTFGRERCTQIPVFLVLKVSSVLCRKAAASVVGKLHGQTPPCSSCADPPVTLYVTFTNSRSFQTMRQVSQVHEVGADSGGYASASFCSAHSTSSPLSLLTVDSRTRQWDNKLATSKLGWTLGGHPPRLHFAPLSLFPEICCQRLDMASFGAVIPEPSWYNFLQLNSHPGELMKLLLVFLAALAFSSGASAQIPHNVPGDTTDHISIKTGNDLLRTCEDQETSASGNCLGYVTGVVDAIGMLEASVDFQGKGYWRDTSVCFPKHIVATHARYVVIKYLKANPNERVKSAAQLIITALIEAWGCPDK